MSLVANLINNMESFIYVYVKALFNIKDAKTLKDAICAKHLLQEKKYGSAPTSADAIIYRAITNTDNEDIHKVIKNALKEEYCREIGDYVTEYFQGEIEGIYQSFCNSEKGENG